jgi:hypothetical protein
MPFLRSQLNNILVGHCGSCKQGDGREKGEFLRHNVPAAQWLTDILSVWQSIAETVIERDLPFVHPRPRHEVGAVAMPLLRLCILQLELSLMVLDTSGAHSLTPEAAKNLEVVRT